MSCKFFSISMYAYIRNTCLHYIDELELVLLPLGYNYYMMKIIHHNYHHRSNAYELFTYYSSLIYFTVATVTITIKPKNITFVTVISTIILLCY